MRCIKCGAKQKLCAFDNGRPYTLCALCGKHIKSEIGEATYAQTFTQAEMSYEALKEVRLREGD